MSAEQNYTGVRAWPAEGFRVGLVSCLKCGAAVLIDPSDTVDMMKLHIESHRRSE